MYADHVKCVYCEKELFVEVGEEICPACLHESGTLTWVNDENPEVEMSSYFSRLLEKEKYIEVTDEVRKDYGL